MPACRPVSQWRTTVRPADSATATKSSRRGERDAVGEPEPVERRPRSVPSGSRRSSRPVRVSWTKSSFHRSMPNCFEESENQTVPSEAMAALLQKTIRTPATLSASASMPPVAGSTRSRPLRGVADQQPTVEGRSRCRAGGRPCRRPCRRCRRRDAPARWSRPSVPVKAAPSSGPRGGDDDVLGAVRRARGMTERLVVMAADWRTPASRGTPGPRPPRPGTAAARVGGRLDEDDLAALAADDVLVGDRRGAGVDRIVSPPWTVNRRHGSGVRCGRPRPGLLGELAVDGVLDVLAVLDVPADQPPALGVDRRVLVPLLQEQPAARVDEEDGGEARSPGRTCAAPEPARRRPSTAGPGPGAPRACGRTRRSSRCSSCRPGSTPRRRRRA